MTGKFQLAFPGLTPIMLVLVIGILPFAMLRQSLGSLLLGLRDIPHSSRADMLYATVMFVATVVLVGVVGMGIVGGLVANLLAVVCGAAISGFWLRRRGASLIPSVDRAILAKTLRFGYRGSVGIILQFFTYRLDLLLVNVLLGSSAAGQYSISSRISELMFVLPGAVGTAIFSRSATSSGEEMNRLAPRSFWITLALSIITAVGLALVGPLAIPLAFSSEFASSYLPMVLLLPGTVVVGSSAVLANDLVGRGRPGIVSIAATCAFVVTVMLDFLLIPSHGLIGAAIASSIAYCGYGVLLLTLYLRTTGVTPSAFAHAAVGWSHP
jgi:O-antigen/teichoic acid export membrane protein